MVLYDAAYPLDIVYLKAKREDKPLSIPLCEVLNGRVATKKLAEDLIVIHVDGQNIEEPEVQYSKLEFKRFIERALKIGEIEELALQPAGEGRTPEVNEFLQKYEI
jgi:hypothetical protein